MQTISAVSSNVAVHVVEVHVVEVYGKTVCGMSRIGYDFACRCCQTRQRRDALAQLLYARTTFAVLKRANSSLKHVGDLDPGRDPAKEVATAPTVAADWQDVTQSDGNRDGHGPSFLVY